MKCKFCGGDIFVGHQRVYMDVLTDGDCNFVDNLPGGGVNIYGAGDPYDPFTCGSCGAIYDELDGSAPMEDPFENCTGPDKTRLAYDGSILFTKVKDELSDRGNRRFQRWDSLSYQVNTAIWEMGHVALTYHPASRVGSGLARMRGWDLPAARYSSNGEPLDFGVQFGILLRSRDRRQNLVISIRSQASQPTHLLLSSLQSAKG